MSQEFWDRGYVVIDDLLDPDQVEFVSKGMDVSKKSGLIRDRGAKFITEAEDEYSPILGELLLRDCRDRIEQAVGRELLQSYAYWRIYRQGAELTPHTDRASSELAVSITIRTDPDGQVWPINVDDLQGNEVNIPLPPGSGIVYLGHSVTHWREPLDAQAHKQLMLFYVLKDGDFSTHAFDGREEDPLAGASA